MPVFTERTEVAPDGNEGFLVRTNANNKQYEYHAEITSHYPGREAHLTLRKVYDNDEGETTVDEEPDATDAVERALETKGYTLV